MATPVYPDERINFFEADRKYNKDKSKIDRTSALIITSVVLAAVALFAAEVSGYGVGLKMLSSTDRVLLGICGAMPIILTPIGGIMLIVHVCEEQSKSRRLKSHPKIAALFEKIQESERKVFEDKFLNLMNSNDYVNGYSDNRLVNLISYLKDKNTKVIYLKHYIDSFVAHARPVEAINLLGYLRSNKDCAAELRDYLITVINSAKGNRPFIDKLRVQLPVFYPEQDNNNII